METSDNLNTGRPDWTVTQLYAAMQRDLADCHTKHERIMVKAMGGKEIRLHAQAWAQVRKLTPGEVAIASQFGYRG